MVNNCPIATLCGVDCGAGVITSPVGGGVVDELELPQPVSRIE
jgi:hypothetical protein